MGAALMFVLTWAGPTLSLVTLVLTATRPLKDRSVSGIPLPAAVASMSMSMLWFAYGVKVSDPRQIIVNVPWTTLRLVMLGAVVIGVHRASRSRTSTACWLAGVAATFVFVCLAGGPTIGTAAAVVATVARVPQTVFTVRHGAGAGLSPVAYVVSATSAALWTMYGVVHADHAVLWSSVAALILDGLVTAAAFAPQSAPMRSVRLILNGRGADQAEEAFEITAEQVVVAA